MIEEGTFTSFDQKPFYTRHWLPDGTPKLHLVVFHGYAEHCGRYDPLAAHFTAHGFAVHSMDHRGHGRSPGKMGYIHSFDELHQDLDHFFEYLRPRLDGAVPLILAHSMGGLIFTSYRLQRDLACKGVVLSSPFLQIPDDVSPFLIKVAGVLGVVAPWLPVSTLDANKVARNRAVVAEYVADPHNYHGKILARTGAAINTAIIETRAKLGHFTDPVLLFHGTADGLAPCKGSQFAYDHMGSESKTLKIYDDGFHELMNDDGREEVIAMVTDWLLAHAG